MVVRSNTIEVRLGPEGELTPAPFWMQRLYQFAKRFGLVNLQKNLEDKALENNWSLE